ncbi:hypothetical protein F2Q69_00018820 [Brassica cretica]|uniref:Uncharacterized protein n=1 Tax=Brassica cretica TaxID=69181 RepID=A0A8S9QFP2_BRACR|nr:hypothetical protein F2Q69_00018820 [Brassica cretica]
MASTRAAWPRSVRSEHDVSDSNPWPASTRAIVRAPCHRPSPRTGVGRVGRPRFAHSEWPSRPTIRGSLLSAVHARGRPLSLHLVHFTPSYLLLLHKPSYLQLEPHQTYNTTYAYAMHLIGL